MTDQPALDNPQMVSSVCCDGCSTGFVTSRGPGQPMPPTALAGQWAVRDGWRADRTYLSGWRCPRCRGRYGDHGAPRRFTIREVLARHRAKQAAT